MDMQPSPTEEQDFWQLIEQGWADSADVRKMVDATLSVPNENPPMTREQALENLSREMDEETLRRKGFNEEQVVQIRENAVRSVIRLFGGGINKLNLAGQLLSSHVNDAVVPRIEELVFGLPAQEVKSFLLTKNHLKGKLFSSVPSIISDGDHYHFSFVIALGKQVYERVLAGKIKLPILLMSEHFAYMLERRYEEEIDGEDEDIRACQF